jgi:hypothetical protein
MVCGALNNAVSLQLACQLSSCGNVSEIIFGTGEAKDQKSKTALNHRDFMTMPATKIFAGGQSKPQRMDSLRGAEANPEVKEEIYLPKLVNGWPV